MDQSKAAKYLKDPRNKNDIAWFQRRADLWGQWYKLKEECKVLSAGSNSFFYPKYLDLETNPGSLNTYLTWGEVDEELDNPFLKEKHLNRGNDLRDSYLLEMNSEYQLATEGYIPRAYAEEDQYPSYLSGPVYNIDIVFFQKEQDLARMAVEDSVIWDSCYALGETVLPATQLQYVHEDIRG